MAQPIQCDAHNMEHLADWLVTRLEDGEVMAYCTPGYLDFMQFAVDAAAQSEIETTDTAALARLQAGGSLEPEPTGELDAAAVEARLDPAAQGTWSEADRATIDQAMGIPAEPVGSEPAQEDPTPLHTVRRGTSARARAHQERVAAGGGDAGPADAGGPGDDDDDDDDGEDATPTP